jgi:lipoprotein-anchoring transpeptidase ErfK/SrfK
MVLFLILPVLIVFVLNLSNNFNIALAENKVDQNTICEKVCSSPEFNDVKRDCFIKCMNKTSAITYNTEQDVACDNYDYPWCGKNKPTDIADLVSKFYNYALAAVGVAALGAIIFGGIKYTVSAGNPSGQTDAISWITGAVWGLVLLLGANLLLRTINPKLVNLEMTKLAPVKVENKFNHQGTASGTDSHSSESNSGQGKPVMSTYLQTPDVRKLGEKYVSRMNPSNTSILIDKSDKKAYVFFFGDKKEGELIATIPINIGSKDLNGEKTGGVRNDKITPTGDYTITDNRKFNTEGVSNKEGANLGVAFIGISAKDENGEDRGIGLHGGRYDTLNPTNGCIRFKNSDLPVINEAFKTGTKIRIRN